jgi:hypothetical protein
VDVDERRSAKTIEQLGNDFIDNLTVRPISARRAIKALEPFILEAVPGGV